MPEENARRWLVLLPLLLLAAAFLVSDPYLTHVEDEVWVISETAQPFSRLLDSEARGQGGHPHPSLYDLAMVVWVRLTDAAPRLVRLPSILFFVVGLWVWSLVAAHLAGPRAQLVALWLGVLWPYGYHYGRLANWYPLAFLLMGLTTLAYLRLLEARGHGHQVFFLASAAALLYTTYYGWAILALIGVDFYLRERRNPQVNWWAMFAMATVLALAFIPLWRHLLGLLTALAGSGAPPAERLLGFAAGAWALFVSESVAPWIWRMSLPAAAAAAGACLLLLWGSEAPLRRMFLGGWLLLAGMAVLGVGHPRRLLLLAGWILVPAAVALVRMEGRWRRAALALALAVPAGIGWYGAATRTHYAAPRFLEPWHEAVDMAVDARRRGAVIVGNDPVFFYYLTHRLAAMESSPPPFAGLLPRETTDRLVFDPAGALAGVPLLDRSILFVRGGEPAADAGQTERLLAELDQRCLCLAERQLLRDPGYARKREWWPWAEHPEWRIEVFSYACMETAAQPRPVHRPAR